MKTKEVISAKLDGLSFTYYDVETDTPGELRLDESNDDNYAEAAKVLKCSPELLKALAEFAERICELVGEDLRDIWKKLEGEPQ